MPWRRGASETRSARNRGRVHPPPSNMALGAESVAEYITCERTGSGTRQGNGRRGRKKKAPACECDAVPAEAFSKDQGSGAPVAREDAREGPI